MGGCRKNSVPIPFVQRDVPKGTIAFWSGSIATIPLTWRLCDGSRFTPNLLNRFNVGADPGGLYNPNDTGGQIIHAHDFTSDTHTHTLPSGPEIGVAFEVQIQSATAQGRTDIANGLPPYHSLLPIMYDGRLR